MRTARGRVAALALTGSVLVLGMVWQCVVVSADDHSDGGDDDDGNNEDMSEEQQAEMDVGRQGGGWPFTNIRGDSAHEPLFQVQPALKHAAVRWLDIDHPVIVWHLTTTRHDRLTPARENTAPTVGIF